MTIDAFIDTIWAYYKKHKRDLPWRNTTDPYLILVSEMMLQQTQVSRVLIKYSEFTKLFPNFTTLHRASMKDVLGTWKGLGYNRRAYFLKAIAEEITKNHDGVFPTSYKDMLELPGIGQSTAGALSAFAYNKKEPFIETNIRTVYMHIFFKNKDQITDTQINKKIQETLAKIKDSQVKDFYYALYDYGSMLKQTLGKSRLDLHKKSKHYKKQSKFEGSQRQLRSLILDIILKSKTKILTEQKISNFLETLIKQSKITFEWNQATKTSIATILKDLSKKKQILEITNKNTSKPIGYKIP